MKMEQQSFRAKDNTIINYYKWSPKLANIKAAVQISHGMAEIAERYSGLAENLTNSGYLVYGNDHRGHGKTAESIDKLGVVADKEGFSVLVDDMYEFSKIIKLENNIPLFVLGHSMGSFLVQRYIQLHGKEIQGALLSGTNGKQVLVLDVGLLAAGLEILFRGRNEKSTLMNSLCFGGYNKAFEPVRTPFDWLSRDNAEVYKYISNKYCGSIFPSGFFYDLFSGLKQIEQKENMAMIPKNLPIYIFSGSEDPVGKAGKGVLQLIDAYKHLGLTDVTYKLYPGGRHEMLHEINSDEVTRDLLIWLNSKF